MLRSEVSPGRLRKMSGIICLRFEKSTLEDGGLTSARAIVFGAAHDQPFLAWGGLQG